VGFQLKGLDVFLCVHIRHQILSANIRAIFVLEVQRKASRSSSAVHSRSSSFSGLEIWNTSKERISATTLCATLLRPSYVIVIVAVITFSLFFYFAKVLIIFKSEEFILTRFVGIHLLYPIILYGVGTRFIASAKKI